MAYRVLTTDDQKLLICEQLQAIEARHFVVSCEIRSLQTLGGENPALGPLLAEQTALALQLRTLEEILDELEGDD